MSVVTARSDGGHAVGRHTEVVLLQSAFTSQKSMKFGVRCFVAAANTGVEARSGSVWFGSRRV